MGLGVTSAIIAAKGANNVIGVRSGMPWKLKCDMNYFKETTKNHPVIMGRGTWESLPKRPLKDRENFVLSHEGEFRAPGAHVYTCIDTAQKSAESIARKRGLKYVFFIGGAEVYGQAIERVDVLFITDVVAEPYGDAYFPRICDSQWTFEEEVLRKEADEVNEYDFVVKKYVRKVLNG